VYLAILYAGHGAALLGAHLALGGDSRSGGSLRPRLALASNACIGGPATAAALAASKGWPAAVGPAMCVGTVGYAVASFLALATYRLCFK